MSSQYWVETLGCPKNPGDSDLLLVADGWISALAVSVAG